MAASLSSAVLSAVIRRTLTPVYSLHQRTAASHSSAVLSAVIRRNVIPVYSLHQRTPVPRMSAVSLRWYSAPGQKKHTTFTESSDEYSFVERLIPPSRVPAPPHHDGPAPSGWHPPSATTPSLPYAIGRSRMHNLPVYTDRTHGNRDLTLVRRVAGDVWALEREVKAFLRERTGRDIPTQVNEVTRTLKVKGDFSQELTDWLLQKGF